MNRGLLRGFGSPAISGRLIRRHTYTSGSGVHYFRSATKRVRLTLVPGGYGGYGGGTNAGARPPGGPAGEVITVELPIEAFGRSADYIVGAGGIGGTGLTTANGNPGGAGSLTRFGTITASGRGLLNNFPMPLMPGRISGGDTYGAGNTAPGQDSVAGSGSSGATSGGYLGGSPGGDSGLGRAGDGGDGNSAGKGFNGKKGQGPGAGGGGGGQGLAGSGGGGNGGDGYPGIIILEEFA